MALPALKDVAAQISIMPPDFRLGEALGLADDIQEFNRKISSAEVEVSVWRAKSMQKLREGFEQLRQDVQDMPPSVVGEAFRPVIDSALEDIRALVVRHETPFGDDPRLVPILEKMKKAPAQARRYFKDQIQRADAIRVKYHDTFVSAYYEMLAFRAEFDPEAKGGPTFDNADDLIAYLRS